LVKKTHLFLAIATVLFTVFGGAAATIASYASLTEKVNQLDLRLARIERALDSRYNLSVK
jgi:hypothetical protein